jgi:HEAT repeat protein
MPEADIQQLFTETLHGDYDDDAPWDAVRKLRQLGTREVFDVATRWCSSTDPLMRARGIDVLAQLGKTVEHPTNSFPDESYSVITNLLTGERDVRPLNSAIAALGHLDDPRAVPLIAQFRSYPSAETRFAVACALGSFPNEPLSVETLLTLMSDSDEDVRDWATFGVGVLGDADSSMVRDALVRAVNDSSEDVREEALVALGKRQDKRALAPLLMALKQPTVTERVIEAAYTLLGLESEQKDWTSQDYANALNKRFWPMQDHKC